MSLLYCGLCSTLNWNNKGFEGINVLPKDFPAHASSDCTFYPFSFHKLSFCKKLHSVHYFLESHFFSSDILSKVQNLRERVGTKWNLRGTESVPYLSKVQCTEYSTGSIYYKLWVMTSMLI